MSGEETDRLLADVAELAAPVEHLDHVPQPHDPAVAAVDGTESAGLALATAAEPSLDPRVRDVPGLATAPPQDDRTAESPDQRAAAESLTAEGSSDDLSHRAAQPEPGVLAESSADPAAATPRPGDVAAETNTPTPPDELDEPGSAEAPTMLLSGEQLAQAIVSERQADDEPETIVASQPAPASTEGRTCSACGGQLSATAQFCRSCGAQMEAPLSPATETGACPKCGEPVEPFAHFCRHCGETLAPAPSSEPASSCEMCGALTGDDELLCRNCSEAVGAR
jgi:hypothetical protein